MSSIDERIVEMKFNNSQFEKGIKETTSSLDGLKKSLSLDGARKGLDNIQEAAKGFSLASISNGINELTSKFTALSAIGVVALGNLTSAAVQSGIQIIKSLTVDPISQGLKEYETNLTGIQTILANTKSKGENLQSVGNALDDLNAYSDKTIYNFGQMVTGIKTLTTAGADLKTGVNTVKGFANAAALAGVGANEMASALQFGLTQAISKGKMMTQDWMSLETSGLAGEGFKNSIIETARVNGIAIDDIIKKNGSFRESLSEGWLTADILQQTLAKYTGEMTDAQLKQLGYTDEQIVSIQAMAAEAVKSATKVKTLSQLFDTLKEASGSGWAKTWQLLFGDLEEAITMFTNVSDVIGGMIQASADARNGMLKDWKALGGRTAIIDAISNAFKAVMSVIKPITDAFKDIFPPTTGKQLYDITMAIKNFTAGLTLSAKSSEGLKNTFRGLFAVLDIIWMAIKAVAGVFFRILAPLNKTGEGVLTLTGGLGNMLVNLRDAIKSGNFFGKVFDFIGNAIAYPIELLNKFGKALVGNTQDSTGFATVWDNIGKAFQAVWQFMKPAVDWIIDSLKVVGNAISDFFKQMNPASFAAILAGGGVAGLGIGIFKFVELIRNTFGVLGFGIIDQIKGVLGTVKDNLKAMQTEVNSKTLKNIAVAIGILAVAVLILSFIPIERLATSLGAITVMLTQLVGAMVLFQKFIGTKGAANMTLISIGLIGLATAMVIFAAAITIMAALDWNELARGLSGMAVSLGLMIAAVQLLSKIKGNLIAVSFGLTVFATGMVIMAAAMKIFASLTWEEIARGLAVMGGMLAVIAGFSKVMGKIGGVVKGAAGLIIIAGAMLVMAAAMKVFATMSWEEIGRGLTLLGGSLAILVLAMKFMEGSVVGAAAMVIVAAAMIILAGALKIMATMSWDEIGRALVVLAGSLAILAGAMALMGIPLVMAGSIGIIAAAGAMMVLAPALKMLGKMSWDEIGRGLTMLAASLVILAVGGVLLIAALPGLIGLGIAAVLIGAGALAAGIGITMLSAGLIALGAASTVGTAALVFMATQLIGLIPLIALKIGEGIIAIAGVIATSGPTLIAAFVTVIMAMVTAINTTAPAIINTFFNVIMLLVQKLEENVPKFVESGMKMIAGILKGIGDNIGSVVTAAVNIIVNFIDAISKNLPRIISAGINLIISFVNGLADGIRKHRQAMSDAGWNLAGAILDGMTGGLGSAAVSKVVSSVKGLGTNIINAIKAILGIRSPSKEFFKIGEWTGQGLSNGITSYTDQVGKDAGNLGSSAMDGLKKSISGISDIALANVDMTPTIRPVLDLSAIKKDSSLINGMIAPAPLSIDAGYTKAASISVDEKQAKMDAATVTDTIAPAGDTNISFVQNNTSPKALTASEIYRQTKNQISAVKGVVVLA
jgi:hypothetical protein